MGFRALRLNSVRDMQEEVVQMRFGLGVSPHASSYVQCSASGFSEFMWASSLNSGPLL